MASKPDALPDAAKDVLAFWLGDAPTATEAPQLKRWVERWFTRDESVDTQISERFGGQLAAARRGELDDWALTTRGRLALVIVLDQFSRNLHRGSASAFAGDAAALALATAAVDHDLGAALAPIERVFLYLPFEHDEALASQERAVALFGALAAQAPAGIAGAFSSFHDYAIRHRDVIARFGRFPHRNAALGRANTAAEAEYLAQPGSGF
jgi:uncharacterized protein (DUF924 family)